MPKHNKERKKKRKYIDMNSRVPNLYGTIKLHKQVKSIRPIVNWMNCQAYKVAEHLNEMLREAIQLPYMFNVKNSTTLMHTLMENKIT
jgi:hypothetical protein